MHVLGALEQLMSALSTKEATAEKKMLERGVGEVRQDQDESRERGWAGE